MVGQTSLRQSDVAGRGKSAKTCVLVPSPSLVERRSANSLIYSTINACCVPHGMLVYKDN